MSHLLQRRIYESKYLLRDTDLSISQISTIFGFSSLSYFAQAFKSTNFSPLQYQNHQNIINKKCL
ncbi:MAG: helix-turn-helix domain-containing protein [Thomasclavelia ramosa]